MLNVTMSHKVHRYSSDLNALGLLEYVAATLGVLVSLALIFCLCCFCMKLSDLKMKSYIMELAKKRGVKLDMDKLDQRRNCQSPLANENCAIFVPDKIDSDTVSVRIDHIVEYLHGIGIVIITASDSILQY